MDVTAASGRPEDLQAAINQVAAAGGGTVYVPAGDFVCNPPTTSQAAAVTLPLGVNLIGTGKGKTILRETIDINALYGVSTYMVKLPFQSGTGTNRISGISFIGHVIVDAGNGQIAIGLWGRVDFRIDNCVLQDFNNQGIITWGCRGLIDHCDFDNPYKDTMLPHNPAAAQPWGLWGYGIIVVGGGTSGWTTDITKLLGKYYITGANTPVYIEDCTFTRCRHGIAANTNGFYVARHNTFSKAAPYMQTDGHGGVPGTRLMEVYENVFDLTDESYSLGQDAASDVRGGAAMVTGNVIKLNNAYNTPCLQLFNDGEAAPYDVEQVYAWGNTVVDQMGNVRPYGLNIVAPIAENVNYFLREPTLALDGFTYTKFQYPHPLQSGQGPPPNVPVLGISISTSATSILAGTSLTFQAAITGSTTATVQWFETANITTSAGLGPSLTVAFSNAGTFTIYAVAADPTTSNGTAQSNSITITVTAVTAPPSKSVAARSIGPLALPAVVVHGLWRLRERYISKEVHRKLHPLV